MAALAQQRMQQASARRPAPFKSHAVGRRAFGAGLLAASVIRTPRVMASAASGDLLVVGPGVLGSCLGKLWLDEGLGAVVGRTNTTNNHEKLANLGITPVTKEQEDGRKYPYVAFSAPPSGSADYPAEVKAALDKWDGTGAFVFTSSMSVAGNSGLVTEETPTVPLGAAPSTDKLLQAEAAAIEGGGNVVRLVGLYHRSRGAHTFFLKQGEVARPADWTVNLIHYEDAARLAFSVLKGDGLPAGEQYRGRVFVGSDNHPVTFGDMMEACTSSGVFQGEVRFTGTLDPNNPGKRVDNSATRSQLQWQPKYASFRDFMFQGAKDFYCE